MAKEVSVSVNLVVRKGNLQFNQQVSKSIDMTGSGGPTPGYLTIGTTEENTTFPELSTEGWLLLQNLDATNYIQWGFSTGVYGGRMNAGETAGPFRMEPGLTLYLKANTAACKCQVMGFEA
jgi:hypothetical protein